MWWHQTIHCLYIFNRKGACLYYREWNRPHSTLADNLSEDRKLLFGLHFSLKKLVEKLSPTPYVRGGWGSSPCARAWCDVSGWALRNRDPANAPGSHALMQPPSALVAGVSACVCVCPLCGACAWVVCGAA